MREERGLVQKEAGQVGWEERNCSTCHDRIHCEGGAAGVGSGGSEDALVLKEVGSIPTAQLLLHCLFLIPPTHILSP